jgi:hypothetical protein
MTGFFDGWVQSDAARKDSIDLKRVYIDLCEGNLYDAVLFSQIMFWHEPTKLGKQRLEVFRKGEYWLAKRYEDWQEECRIDANTARKCIDRLVKLGLIVKEIFHFNKKPTVHLRINKEVFEQRILALSDTTGQISDASLKRPNVSDGTTGQMHLIPQVSYYITETTDIDIKDSAPEIAAVSVADVEPKSPSQTTTPNQGNNSSHSQTRPIDPLFEAVKQHVFQIDDVNAQGGRIAKISNWLAGKYAGNGSERVGKISHPAAPEHVEAFGKWCRNKGMTPPRDFVKFVEMWRTWASQHTKAAEAVAVVWSPAPAPPEPPRILPSKEERLELVAKAKEQRAAVLRKLSLNEQGDVA